MFYTLEDICRLLHIGKTTAYGLVKSGKMAAFKRGKIWLIDSDEFEKFVKNERSRNFPPF